jgi:hypothetical protein
MVFLNWPQATLWPNRRLVSIAFLLTFVSIGTAAAQSDLLVEPQAGSLTGQRLQLPARVSQAVAGSRPLYELSAATRLNLAIGLPLRNQAQLDTFLAQVSDPSSPNFQHYLTPAQFADEFGPSEQDYQSLIQFAESSGLTVTATHPNRMLLDVAAPVPVIERALHVKMMVYNHPVRGEFYAPSTAPSLDTQVQVLDISGLDNFEPPHPMGIRTAPLTASSPYVTGSGPGGYFIGKDFRAAYAPNVTLTGAGQTVGLLEFDGFFAADVQNNFSAAGLPVVPTQTILLDGYNGAAGSDNTEVILDIMMASYMAPGLSKVIVYEGEVPNDILNRMATDNLAQQLSSSWGFGGVNATTEQIFKEYVAQGQSVFQASGDGGAYTDGVMTPSDDPSLTVVGGTTLTTNGAGGPWQAETTWSGSGGGVSTVFTIPTYQQSLSMTANHGSTKMRNIPDVALTGDPQIFLIQSNGQAIVVGGTSAATPLWAGFVALANQQAAANAKPRVGFLNPLVYAIGSGSNYGLDFNDIKTGNNSGFNAVAGYDLATGWGSPAGQHLIYDLTGTSGGPSFTLSSSAAALSIKPGGTGIATLTVKPANSFSGSVTLAATGLPAGVTAAFSSPKTSATSTVTFTASSAALAGVYPVTITGVSGTLSSTATITLTVVAPSFTLTAGTPTLSIARTATGSSAISIAGQNGFTGTVSLAATGLPSGVTAVFSPASATAASSLTFIASSSATIGTSTITVTGTSGTLKASATISLTVTAAPSFTLAFAPASLSLPRGLTASGTTTIAAQNGFKGTVAFSATGLPTGVTASFGAVSSTGTSLVTFTATSAATVGTVTVTLKGVSGSLTATANVSLSVIAPATGTALVNLAPSYNVNAFVVDGQPFTGGGLDGGLNGSATAYSANLVGTQQTIAGTLFYFGPANALDSVSSKTVVLPAGQFSSLKFLATGVNGAQTAQVFKVTYTDGTSTSFTQSLSDWFTPQHFSGETTAFTMAHRDNSAGQLDNRTFYFYEYSFALNTAKTVASITLPNNRNVVLLAGTLAGVTAAVH